MNYLQLVQRAHSECEAAGSGPSAVTSQTGENLRMVNWVAQAYTEIQELHQNWRWMRSTWTVNTVAGTDAYAYTSVTDSRLSATIDRFSHWWVRDEDDCLNVKRYLSSAGVGTEGELTDIPWSNFRVLYKRGTQNNGFPAHVTVDPQNKLVFGPKPDDVYVMSGEYQMSPQTLAADADTPEMPTQFHMLVVYRAMEKYGAAKGAVEVFQRGSYEGGKMLRALELNQRPGLRQAPPLA